jgi:hypothetical protein
VAGSLSARTDCDPGAPPGRPSSPLQAHHAAYERDQGKSATAIVTTVHEAGDVITHLGGRPESDQPAGALQDPPLAQRLDLRLQVL